MRRLAVLLVLGLGAYVWAQAGPIPVPAIPALWDTVPVALDEVIETLSGSTWARAVIAALVGAELANNQRRIAVTVQNVSKYLFGHPDALLWANAPSLLESSSPTVSSTSVVQAFESSAMSVPVVLSLTGGVGATQSEALASASAAYSAWVNGITHEPYVYELGLWSGIYGVPLYTHCGSLVVPPDTVPSGYAYGYGDCNAVASAQAAAELRSQHLQGLAYYPVGPTASHSVQLSDGSWAALVFPQHVRTYRVYVRKVVFDPSAGDYADVSDWCRSGVLRSRGVDVTGSEFDYSSHTWDGSGWSVQYRYSSSFPVYSLRVVTLSVPWGSSSLNLVWSLGFSDPAAAALGVAQLMHWWLSVWGSACGAGSVTVPPPPIVFPWDTSSAAYGEVTARDGSRVGWFRRSGLLDVLTRLFVPTRPLAARIADLSSLASDRFPWSVLASLRAPGLSEAALDSVCFDLGHGYNLCPESSTWSLIGRLSRAGWSLVAVVAVWWWLTRRVIPRLEV